MRAWRRVYVAAVMAVASVVGSWQGGCSGSSDAAGGGAAITGQPGAPKTQVSQAFDGVPGNGARFVDRGVWGSGVVCVVVEATEAVGSG